MQKSATKNISRRGKMKAIILAGGQGTRLRPVTKYQSKQLLLVYNVWMIFYALEVLLKAGIKDIMVIYSPENAGDYVNILTPLERPLGIKFTFKAQTNPNGLPEAFILGEDFIGNDNVTLILGDNIFEDDFTKHIQSFKEGGLIFGKKVDDPRRFGVVSLNDKGVPVKIEEKPKNPQSNLAIPGLYIFDSSVVSISKKLKPSARNELEIVHVHEAYMKKQALRVEKIHGYWNDAGTPDSLLAAASWVAEKEKADKKFFTVLNPQLLKEIYQ
jgi:glucose-1-phosphate thymidylyltransferase